MAGVQTVTCVLLDGGREVLDGHFFPQLFEACFSLLSNKFASDAKHVAAVLLYGARRTHNPLAEASSLVSCSADSNNNSEIKTASSYAHVEVVRAFLPIDWHLLSQLREALKPGGNPSDPLDAIIVAADLFEKSYNKAIANKKVECFFYLLTGPQPFCLDADAAAVRTHLANIGIRLVRVAPKDFSPCGCLEGGAPFLDRELLLRDFVSWAHETVAVRAKKTVTKCRLHLQLAPSVKVAAFVFILAKKEAMPPLRKRLKVSKAASATAHHHHAAPAVRTPQYLAVSSERFLYRANDPQRQPVSFAEVGAGRGGVCAPEGEGLAYAFPLGKQWVSLSAFEKDAHFSINTERGLLLVGVVPLSSVKHWWILGQTELVVAAEGDAIGATAFASLFWASVRLRCALLCRYTARQGSLPLPVLLLPRLCCEQQQQQQLGERVQLGFCLVQLPFADDVACATFPLSPPSTEKEVFSLEHFIDTLMLSRSHEQQQQQQQQHWEEEEQQQEQQGGGHCRDMGLCRQLHPLCVPLETYLRASEKHQLLSVYSSDAYRTFLPRSASVFGEKADGFVSSQVPNPTIQRFLRMLTNKVAEAADPQHVQQQQWQQQQQQQKQQQQQEGEYSEVIRAVEDLFVPPPASLPQRLAAAAAAGEKAEAGSAAAAAAAAAVAALFPLVAEGPLRDAAVAAAAAKASAADALTKELVRKENVLKLSEVRLQQQLPGAAAAGKLDQQQQQEQEHQEYSVKSLNPIKDFEQMLQVRETDLTEKAIAGMQQVILQLLQHAQEHSSAAAADPQNQQQQQEQQHEMYGLAARYLVKAMMCLEALRRGCMRELEGKAFNAFLRQLQQHAAAEAAAAAAAVSGVQAPLAGAKLFWDLFLAKRQLPLITTDEDPHADVPPEHARCIYTSQQQQQQQQQQTGDVFDLIE